MSERETMGFVEVMRAKRLWVPNRETASEPLVGPPDSERQWPNKRPFDERESGGLAKKRVSAFCVRSRVLNAQVDVEFRDDRPDVVLIGGVVYRGAEIKDLLSRNLAPKNLRAVHEIKRVFEGTVCEGVQAMG